MIFADAPTDFWGIVVPGWIGAIGGLVGGVVAVVSLLIAVRSNEKASAARAAEAETRAVVVDTIAELQRENADAARSRGSARRISTDMPSTSGRSATTRCCGGFARGVTATCGRARLPPDAVSRETITTRRPT